MNRIIARLRAAWRALRGATETPQATWVYRAPEIGPLADALVAELKRRSIMRGGFVAARKWDY